MSSPSSEIQLWLTIESEWHRVLVIPVEDILRLCIYPLKWLQFIAATVYGADGALHQDKPLGTVAALDITANFASNYYFLSTGEPRLLDPLVLDDRTSASVSGPRNTPFQTSLVVRDQWCITSQIVDLPSAATACHIIPHSKGSQYMRNLFQHRCSHLEAPVLDIDDIRNGILLYDFLHRPFGKGHLAFLQTPNKYLSPSDIPLCSNESMRSSDPSPASRLVLQYFQNPGPGILRLAEHNCDCRIPTFSPPAQHLLDFVYAAAVLTHWGSPTTLRTNIPNPLNTEAIIEKYYPYHPDDGNASDIGTPREQGSPNAGSQQRLVAPLDEGTSDDEGMSHAMDFILSLRTQKQTENKRVHEWVEKTRAVQHFDVVEGDNLPFR